MIKIRKKIINYTYLLKKIYCCNCFLDDILYLIEKDDLQDDEFFEINEKKFQTDNFLTFLLGSEICLCCLDSLKFIRQKSMKNDIFIKKKCVDDFVFCDEERIEICSVCFLDLLRNSNLLTVFSIDKKLLENEKKFL